MLREQDRLFPVKDTWATVEDYIWRFECLNGLRQTVRSPDGLFYGDPPAPRPAPKRRREIFDASGGCCHYCSVPLDVYSFHVEHKIPKARGGSNERANLVAACARCNLHKHTKTDEEYINAVKTLANLAPKLESAQSKLRAA